MAMKKGPLHGFHISRFYVIYLAVTISVILIIIASLGVVSKRLAEYEEAQPKYVAAEVFEKYFTVPLKYDALLADAVFDRGGATDAEIIEYLSSEIGSSELSYSKGLAAEDGTVKYVVRAGSKQLGAIILSVSDKKTEHGFSLYELSRVELNLNVSGPEETETEGPPTLTLSFDVPSSYTVTVDGVALSTENVTSTHLRPDVLEYYPSGVEGVEYTVYTLTTLYELPEKVEVKDLLGGTAEVTFDADTNTYTAGIIYSEQLASEHTEFVTEALKWYAAYLQRVPGYKASKISSYFEEGSVAYENIKTVAKDLWMMTEPSGSDFENVTASEFYALSANVLTCRVRLTQILHRNGKEDNADTIDMYLFFHQTADGYRIYEMYNAQ